MSYKRLVRLLDIGSVGRSSEQVAEEPQLFRISGHMDLLDRVVIDIEQDHAVQPPFQEGQHNRTVPKWVRHQGYPWSEVPHKVSRNPLRPVPDLAGASVGWAKINCTPHCRVEEPHQRVDVAARAGEDELLGDRPVLSGVDLDARVSVFRLDLEPSPSGQLAAAGAWSCSIGPGGGCATRLG